MGADGNAALDQETGGLGHRFAAFELDHLGAGCEEGGGVAEGVRRAFLKTAEGHVGDNVGVLAAAGDGGRVVGHVGDADGER